MSPTPEEKKEAKRQYAKQRYANLKDKLGYNRFPTKTAGVYILKSTASPVVFVGASHCIEGRFATHRNFTIPRMLSQYASPDTWNYECVLELTSHNFSVQELNVFEWLYLLYLQGKGVQTANCYNVKYNDDKHAKLIWLYNMLDVNAQSVVRTWCSEFSLKHILQDNKDVSNQTSCAPSRSE